MIYEFDGFEWDEKKRIKVFLERNIDIDIAVDAPLILEDGKALTGSSAKKAEERYKTVGKANGKLYTVVHTPRNGKCRIITMRRAHMDEEEVYYGSNQ